MRTDNHARTPTEDCAGPNPGRALLPGIAVLALVIMVACTSTGARPTTSPTDALVRRFVLDFVHVPSPPADLSPEISAAWMALRAGDAVASEQSLSLASATARSSGGGQSVLGFLSLARGATAEARTRFQQALVVAPDYAVALYGLGFLAEAQGNRTAGQDWYRRAVEVDPSLSAAAVRLQVLELEQAQGLIIEGELAEARGDSAAALGAYGAANAMAPNVLEPYMRIAEIRRAEGDLEGAIRTLRAARDQIGDVRVVLEPLGHLLQENGSHAEAYDVFQALEEVAPGDPGVRAMVSSARELYFTTSLPEPYRQLEEKPEIVRADLAALIAIRMPNLGDRVSDPRTGVIMSDIDDTWAEPYIRQIVEWNIMRAFQNHAFRPDLVVKRQMFAEVAYRVLEMLGATDNAPRARLGDVASEHYLYDQIGVVVGYDILRLGPRNSFGILEPVSGAEAVAAVQRLVRIARSADD